MTSKKFSHTNLGPILRALVDGPLTTVQLQHKTGISIQTARSICKSLYKAKLLHIHHWHISNSTYLPAYRFAEGTDASKDDRLGITQAKILDLLKAQPARYHLAEKLAPNLELSVRTVLLQLNALEQRGLVSSRNTLPKQWRYRTPPPQKTGTPKGQAASDKEEKPTPRPKAPPQSWFSVLGTRT